MRAVHAGQQGHVGAGWAFPAGLDALGTVALAGGDRQIEQSIRLILGTAPGERPMRPDFGCALHELVFAPADASTAGRAAYEVRRSIERWEPRIALHDVTVGFEHAEAGMLTITLRYTVVGERDPRAVTVPFQLFPADAPDPVAAAHEPEGR
ncbi:GPW/gp25 family protein [Dactylosporangium sp. CA-152071]|uniref:GPW/gp25 family protein n=1 Tax=Dactylosporangium sp. CA-152071 TaxID=3239933 RepID=UPI003D8DE946